MAGDIERPRRDRKWLSSPFWMGPKLGVVALVVIGGVQYGPPAVDSIKAGHIQRVANKVAHPTSKTFTATASCPDQSQLVFDTSDNAAVISDKGVIDVACMTANGHRKWMRGLQITDKADVLAAGQTSGDGRQGYRIDVTVGYNISKADQDDGYAPILDVKDGFGAHQALEVKTPSDGPQDYTITAVPSIRRIS